MKGLLTSPESLPLINTFSLISIFLDEQAKPKVGAATGVAATSAIVGCFAEKNAALEAAKGAMDRLVEGVEGVNRSEAVGLGSGGRQGRHLSTGINAKEVPPPSGSGARGRRADGGEVRGDVGGEGEVHDGGT